MAHVPPSGAAIAEALAERWGDELQAGERFSADVARTPRGISLTAVLLTGADHLEFEAETDGPTAEAFDRAADVVDLLIAEWLEAGRPRLPGVPERRTVEGHEVRTIARLRRPDLEAVADRLLGEHDDED